MGYPVNTDENRIIGKDFFEVVGYFTTDAGSAVLVQTPTVAQGAPVTVSKPAGTGIYRCTFNGFVFNDVFWADAEWLVAAGTTNRDIQPVAKNANSQGFVTSVDFQVRQTSDGAAVDPAAGTIQYRILGKASSLRP